MQILVCEPQCWGLEHAHFNASVLDAVVLAYPEAEVVFMGEPGHLGHVREILSEYDAESIGRIRWKPVTIPPRAMLGWKRFRKELGWAGAVLHEADAARADAIVLCSITGPGIVALKSRLYVARSRVPVLAIMHSVLRTIFDRQSLRPTSWILNMRHAVALPHPRNLRYVTLGAQIHRNLLAMLPDVGSRFTSVEFPYLMHDLPAGREGDAQRPGKTRFGFLGVGNAVKRFDLFASLAARTRATGAPVEFTLVGYLPGGASDEASAVTGVGTTPLSTEEYRRRAFDLTYVVSTSDPAHYHLLGSATFLDSLAFGKPGIFLKSPFLEHYFAQMGDIGYLCDSYEAMVETVDSIARDFPAARYREQCRNIRRHRTHFTPRQIASQVRAITEEARAATSRQPQMATT